MVAGPGQLGAERTGTFRVGEEAIRREAGTVLDRQTIRLDSDALSRGVMSGTLSRTTSVLVDSLSESFGGSVYLSNSSVFGASTSAGIDGSVYLPSSFVLGEATGSSFDGSIHSASSTVFGEDTSSVLDGKVVLVSRTILEDEFAESSDGSVLDRVATVIGGATASVFDGKTILSQTTILEDELAESFGGSVITQTVSPFGTTETFVFDGGVYQSQSSLIGTGIGRSISGSVLDASSFRLSPSTNLLVANNILTRNLSGEGGKVGENRVGNFRLGSSSTAAGPLVGETFNTGSSDAEIANIQTILKGQERSAGFANLSPISATASPVSVEGVTRWVAGDVHLASSIEFVEDVITRYTSGDVLTRTVTPLSGKRVLVSWVFDDRQIGTTVEEVREWDTLSVTLRYRESEDGPYVSQLIDSSENVEVVPIESGGFRGVELGAGSNKLELFAPTDRELLRPVTSWRLDDYDRTALDRKADQYDLELNLVPEGDKAFDNQWGTIQGESFDSSKSSSEWLFDFEVGSIVTKNVDVSVPKSSDGTEEAISLSVVLTQKEARVAEENVSHLNLSKIREVPDGQDVVEDASSDERNTVSVSPPDVTDTAVIDGEYVFDSWETEWIGGAYQVDWELFQK